MKKLSLSQKRKKTYLTISLTSIIFATFVLVFTISALAVLLFVNLGIVKESGGGNPWRRGMIPILGIDCWEHSWYLDYAADKKAHYDALWDIINWDVIEGRLPL